MSDDDDFKWELRRLIDDSIEDLLDRVSLLAHRRGVADEYVSRTLRQIGYADIQEFWDNYAEEAR